MKKTTVRQQIKEAILDPHRTHMYGFKLPTPQTAGTSHQIETYTNMQVDGFLEMVVNFNSNK